MPRAFLVKKSSTLCIPLARGSPGKKATSPDGPKQSALPWEPLDMSEYENGFQTAETVELELDYQGYKNRRTPSPVRDMQLRASPTLNDDNLSSKEDESKRRIPRFYAPLMKNRVQNFDDYNEEDVEKPFECRHCIISFSRLNDLQEHMELHSIKKPFNHTDMRETFSESLIENQLKNNHYMNRSLIRPSQMQFNTLGKPFKSEDNEIDKMDQDDDLFGKPFDFRRRLLFPRTNGDFQHFDLQRDDFFERNERETRTKTENADVNPSEIPFKCSSEMPIKFQECDRSFSQTNDLHYETHNSLTTSRNEDNDVTSDRESVKSEDNQGEKPFRCNHCVMSFTRPSDLQRHLLIHSSNKPYRCDKCDREFTWFGNFQKHILSHMSENSQSTGSYSSMFTLLAREQVKDLFIKEGEKYRCRLCSKDFTRLSGLKTHIRMHTGERPYVCEVCSFAFTTSRALKMHTRLHTGEKPYKCDVCDRAFTRRDEMHTHMYIHKGEKPFKCNECSASFIRYGHLQRHLLIHSDDKPYKCKLCPKSFTQYRNLQTHTYKHTGERPYKCKYCPKGFTQYGTLQAHERTHTGEKPFKCQLCEKAFITSSHLRWHIKTQHSTNQSK